jgi:peptidoglycan/xylan/chitin deacetylase (PgdA/CDA1 family)
MPMRPASLARKAIKASVIPGGALTRRRTGDVLMLVYHRTGAGEREIDLTGDAFAQQIASLARSGVVATLDQALLEGGVVVSIDDGLRDFYDHALPAIVKNKVPVLLYLVTGWVGNAGSDSLSWSQLAEAVATGFVTVGAHTHSHADLSKADAELAEYEMKMSKEIIEDRLGRQCIHFAYPWGVASPAADEVTRRVFHTSAIGWRSNRRGRIDRHRLGRTPVFRSDGRLLFQLKTNGWLDGEAVAYRLLRRGPWRVP